MSQQCYYCGLLELKTTCVLPEDKYAASPAEITILQIMCGKFPTTKFRSSRPPKCHMNELNQNQTSQRSHDHQSNGQTVPRQAVNIVHMANCVNILSNMYRKQLALDAMTSTSGNLTST